MAIFETVRVAAIQATPVILEADATVDKAVDLLNASADDGVQLAVLPETFVSLYPSGSWAYKAARFGGFDELWERMWASSVEVPGPLVDRLVAACRDHGVHCAIGVNERESERPEDRHVAVGDRLPERQLAVAGGEAHLNPPLTTVRCSRGDGNVSIA